jgi:iron complex outermembrane receptor protein
MSNASITFVTKDDRLSIGAFVNNIEDNRVLQFTAYFSTLSVFSGTSSDPRTYGVRLNVNF